MDLITTHLNADFDGLASMVAARKLYPGAVLVLPGGAQESVRGKGMALGRRWGLGSAEASGRVWDVGWGTHLAQRSGVVSANSMVC